jgi:hypothetical protein
MSAMSEHVLWNILVSEQTDRDVRAILYEHGLPPQALAAFVEDAVRWRVLDRSVQTLKDHNGDMDPSELEALLDEEVRAVRRGAATEKDRPHWPPNCLRIFCRVCGMRLVLDSNVLLSALMVRGTRPDLVYAAWKAGRFQLHGATRILTARAMVQLLDRGRSRR